MKSNILFVTNGTKDHKIEYFPKRPQRGNILLSIISYINVKMFWVLGLKRNKIDQILEQDLQKMQGKTIEI